MNGNLTGENLRAYFQLRGDTYIREFASFVDAAEWCSIRIENSGVWSRRKTSTTIETGGLVLWQIPEKAGAVCFYPNIRSYEMDAGKN